MGPQMNRITLYITHKNYSSWSLRVWLVMRTFGIGFTEQVVTLDGSCKIAAMIGVSGTAKVPCLIVHEPAGDLVIWESIAIMEYLAETFGDLPLWPAHVADRARARVLAAEMHAGFEALRNECPMNLRRPPAAFSVSDAVKADVARIETMWQGCFDDCASGGGPFLFGNFSIVDAMYVPVWTRIKTYHLSSHPVIDRFGAAVEAMPEWQKWCAAATGDRSLIALNEV